MRNHYRFFILILLSSASPLFSQSLVPSVISSSGGFYSNDSGMLSFTTGEMSAVETYSTTSSILTQGFQQPWDLGTYINEHPFDDFSFGIYPNPSDGQFYLMTESDLNINLTITIYDLLGKQIKKMQFDPLSKINVESIDVTNYPTGTYILSMLVNESHTDHQHIFNTKITIVK